MSTWQYSSYEFIRHFTETILLVIDPHRHNRGGILADRSRHLSVLRISEPLPHGDADKAAEREQRWTVQTRGLFRQGCSRRYLGDLVRAVPPGNSPPD